MNLDDLLDRLRSSEASESTTDALVAGFRTARSMQALKERDDRRPEWRRRRVVPWLDIAAAAVLVLLFIGAALRRGSEGPHGAPYSWMWTASSSRPSDESMKTRFRKLQELLKEHRS